MYPVPTRMPSGQAVSQVRTHTIYRRLPIHLLRDSSHNFCKDTIKLCNNTINFCKDTIPPQCNKLLLRYYNFLLQYNKTLQRYNKTLIYASSSCIFLVCFYTFPTHTRYIPDTYPTHTYTPWIPHEYSMNTPQKGVVEIDDSNVAVCVQFLRWIF